MPGTEAQRAVDLLKERFPDARADSATARVVFKAPGGHKVTEPGTRAAIEETLAAVKRSSAQVAGVADPFQAGTVSEDRSTAFAPVTYKVGAAALSET